jgi:hypothetical protein
VFIKLSRGEAMKVLRCCIMLFNKAHLVAVRSEEVG